MDTAMDRLEQKVWEVCVYRLAAVDDATVERWQRDHLAVYREHYHVQPLPARYDVLVAEALAEWDRIEARLLERLGLTAATFDARFQAIRQGLVAHDPAALRVGMAFGHIAYGVVRNLSIVNCFACFLPRAVPDRRNELATLGRRITAVFIWSRWVKRWSGAGKIRPTPWQGSMRHGGMPENSWRNRYP